MLQDLEAQRSALSTWLGSWNRAMAALMLSCLLSYSELHVIKSIVDSHPWDNPWDSNRSIQVVKRNYFQPFIISINDFRHPRSKQMVETTGPIRMYQTFPTAHNISVIDIEPCITDMCAMIIKKVKDVEPRAERAWVETSTKGWSASKHDCHIFRGCM